MLGESLALLAAFCWAAGAGFYKRSMRSVNSIGLNLIRSIPATIFLLIMALLLGSLDSFHMLDLAVAIQAVGASIISWLLGDTLYFLGLRSIGVSRAVPLAYSYPIFLLPMSAWLLGEPFNYRVILGTLMIIAAIWLISRSLGSEDARGGGRIGFAASLLAAVFWAIGIALFKHVMFTLDPVFLAFFRMLVLLPFLGLYSMMSSSTRASILGMRRREVVLAAIGGILGVGIGDMFYLMGLDLARANVVGPLSATTPVFAGIIAAIRLREKPSFEIILGIILITIGAALLSQYG